MDDLCEDIMSKRILDKLIVWKNVMKLKNIFRNKSLVLSQKMFSSAEYSDILGHYKFSSVNFDNITQKVHCTGSGNSESLSELQHQSGTSNYIGDEMSISITLSLLGIIFICFLLYKVT